MNPIAKETEALLMILQQEKETISRLLSFSKGKEGMLIAGKIEELNDIVEQEENLVETFQTQETVRADRAASLSRAVGIDTMEVPMRQVLKAVTDAVARNNLEQAREELLVLLKELSEQNEKNNELLHMQKDYNEFMLHLLVEDGDTGNYYNGRGNKKENESGGNTGIYQVYV